MAHTQTWAWFFRSGAGRDRSQESRPRTRRTLESIGAEMLLALCSSGSEISNVWRLTTWN